MEAQMLIGGFENAPAQAATAFRSLMEAMARPGAIQGIEGAQPPAPLSVAAGTALLTLCDAQTPVYLAGAADCEAVRAWLTFHTGAPLCGPEACVFAVGTWEALLPLDEYPRGAPEYPDRSATLLVDMDELSAKGARLSGPGIKDSCTLSLPELRAFQANAALFPLGLDFLFTSGGSVAALPRSTKVF
jgi:alpha-D-ribose 1-methylphosphonate 5-triphosphate synthase subunit PhnH